MTMAINMNDIREYPTRPSVAEVTADQIVGKIRGAKRLTNTPSGNPRWLVGVAYCNGTHLTTASFEIAEDSSAGYDLQNCINGAGYVGANVVLTITKGKITKIQRVEA